MKKVMIVHGFQASPNSHWFPWLESKVTVLGFECSRLELTDSQHPQYLQWKSDLSQQLKDLDENSIIVSHSLGCIAVLDYLSEVLLQKPIKAFIGVAGFQDKLQSLPELNEFIQNTHIDAGVLRKQIQQRHMIFSCNDSYVPAPQTIQLGQLINAQMLEIKAAGHFLEEDGYLEFPELWDRLERILLK